MASQRNLAAMDMEQGTSFPPRHATRIARGCEICKWVLLVSVGLFLTSLLVWSVFEEIKFKEPNYTVAIVGVSGLDRRPVLDPEFNLTVRVAQRSPISHWCKDPGATVRLSYRSFELASAAAPQICETGGMWTVTARGSRVWLPAPEMDSLEADTRSAAGVFDIVMMIPKLHGYGLVISCMGRRVGEDVGGGPLCDVREVKYVRSAY